MDLKLSHSEKTQRLFKQGTKEVTTTYHGGYIVPTRTIIQNPYEILQADISNLNILLKEILYYIKGDQHDIIDIKKASELINLKASTIYNLNSKKEIPVIKRPGSSKLMFSKSALLEWMTEKDTAVDCVNEQLTKKRIRGRREIML